MQVTGTILAVQQRIDNNTNAQAWWQAHGKTFYTFDMTVRGPNGDVSGEINSTTANVYPKNQGDQITVDSYEQNGYPKLKAISDQNQQGGQQQAPPQQQQPPYTPPSQAPPQNDVQARIMFGQAVNCTKDELIAGKIKDCQVERRVRMWENILKTQQFPAYMKEAPAQQPAPQQQAPPPQQQQPPQQPPSQFVQDQNGGYSIPDDGIPFNYCE